MLTIAKTIKELRLKNGLTLLEVAKYLNVQEATVQRYESGQIKHIKYEIICKLAELFHCDPSYIMGWENKSKFAENLDDNNPLSDQEKELLKAFRSLNDEGQEKALEYIADLIASGRYKKDNQSDLVHEA